MANQGSSSHPNKERLKIHLPFIDNFLKRVKNPLYLEKLKNIRDIILDDDSRVLSNEAAKVLETQILMLKKYVPKQIIKLEPKEEPSAAATIVLQPEPPKVVEPKIIVKKEPKSFQPVVQQSTVETDKEDSEDDETSLPVKDVSKKRRSSCELSKDLSKGKEHQMRTDSKKKKRRIEKNFATKSSSKSDEKSTSPLISTEYVKTSLDDLRTILPMVELPNEILETSTNLGTSTSTAAESEPIEQNCNSEQLLNFSNELKNNSILDKKEEKPEEKPVTLKRSPGRPKKIINASKLDVSKEANHKSEDEEKQENKLKIIFAKLSAPGPKDPNLFDEFKSIVGKDSFESLKMFFTSRENGVEPGETSVCKKKSDKDQQVEEFKKPETAREATLVKKPSRKKGRREIDRLNEDIMNMFIRDGVLAAANENARSLRNQHKKAYDEALKDIDLDDGNCSDSSDNDNDTSCSVAGNSSGNSSRLTRSSFSSDRASSIGSIGTASPRRASSVSSVPSSNRATRAHSRDIPVSDPRLLAECRVKLKNIDISKLEFPFKIGADGKPKELGEAENELNAEATDNEINQQANSCTDKPEVQIEIFSEIIEIGDDSEDDSDEQPLIIFTPQKPKIEVKESEIVSPLPTEADIYVSSFLPAELPTMPSPQNIFIGIRQKVSNLSYATCRMGLNLRCNSERCDYSDTDPNMFKYHVQTRHVMARWDGSCSLCNKSVSNYGSLLDEYNHMDTCHMNKTREEPSPSEAKKRKYTKKIPLPTQPWFNRRNNASVSTPPKADASVKTPGSDSSRKYRHSVDVAHTQAVSPLKISSVNSIAKEPEAQNHQFTMSPQPKGKFKIVPKSAERRPSLPLIKFKMLPGDKLSINKQELPNLLPVNPQPFTAASSVTATNIIGLTQATSNSIPNESYGPVTKVCVVPGVQLRRRPSYQLAPQMVPEIVNQTSKRLRPWLDSFDMKLQTAITAMLTPTCLQSLYKCMASQCSFYCTNRIQFQDHSQVHLAETGKGCKFYTRCSYCCFSSTGIELLTDHIFNEHRADLYCCNKCFYRSVTESNVKYHHLLHHSADISGSLVVLKGTNENGSLNVPQNRLAIQSAKEARTRHLSSIACAICKKRFFIFEQFIEHVTSMHRTEELRHRCNKCNEESNFDTLQHHLENCHNIMKYHCLNCKFGARTEKEVLTHIVNTHPSKLPIYCARIADPTKSYPPHNIEVVPVRLFK